MNSLKDTILYLKSNFENIESFYKDFFLKKFSEETYVYSFPPLYKGIKYIDTIIKESNGSYLWQCIFAKKAEIDLNFLPSHFLPEVASNLLEVNFNILQPKAELPEHTDHFDRTKINILLNDLDGDSYISLEKTPLYLRKKFDCVSFNYNKMHGAVNHSSTPRITIAFLFNNELK